MYVIFLNIPLPYILIFVYIKKRTYEYNSSILNMTSNNSPVDHISDYNSIITTNV